MRTIVLFFALAFAACNSDKSAPKTNGPETTTEATTAKAAEPSGKGQHWEGAFTNGMKETYISFDVSEDGKELKELTFKGYWRCDGKLTQDIIGPEESFAIKDGVVDGVIVDKTSYTRFELKGKIEGDKAEGTFRMSITGLGCDTYVLTWTASPKS